MKSSFWWIEYPVAAQIYREERWNSSVLEEFLFLKRILFIASEADVVLNPMDNITDDNSNTL